ncbi:class F sortase [Specibacter cremeus]|uniref:class F sortase n=1 Tax=Specibacter cremeus TaxID=1629051 RepID=UPI000F78F56B|nr:sortase [Specibacter cremeus]
MGTRDRSRRGRRIASAAAALLFAGGATVIGIGVADGSGLAASSGAAGRTASPTTAAPTHPATGGGTPTAATGAPYIPVLPKPATPTGPILPAAIPVTLDVPDIGVHADLMQLGRATNGAAETPPGQSGTLAGWYKFSPAPGQLGPAVILGHINTDYSNIGVFYRLHELRSGDEFTVHRSDGLAAVFRVYKLAEFPKSGFPTFGVYGNTDRAEIRLITCGGFNAASGQYTENTVAYAYLVGSRRE